MLTGRIAIFQPVLSQPYRFVHEHGYPSLDSENLFCQFTLFQLHNGEVASQTGAREATSFSDDTEDIFAELSSLDPYFLP